jgi:hypothetical protein
MTAVCKATCQDAEGTPEVVKSRRSAKYDKRDLKRAIVTVHEAGLKIALIRFPPSGGFEVIPAMPEAVASSNPLDEEFGCHGQS